MIELVGKCDVCGNETRYNVYGDNNEGVFHIIKGDKDVVYRLCYSCAYEVLDFIEQLQEEYREEQS